MNKYLLLVEPHEDTRLMLTYLLEHYGFHVKAVRQGGDALAAALKRQPDTIVTELVFADMSGQDLCSGLRQIPGMSGCRIIALTGSHHLYDEGRLWCDSVLLKPAEITELVDTISR